ncbi:cysteine peptidase family C39 domain-containing protein [Campylobacter sp. MIT 21-1685]|uniref:C39 family peptidase n=1 Tax=unclassified Campylobacter TaxID=2593542 RepID=UPI00224A6C6A|nr:MULTISPECIES: cysteine peptidase family C39 domain-containing protein [unclassified Campylobacter]MCX2683898.1 cysteine peptidase family C39 domain-containing protein [Campylobacter sp. MIT 21-1684]MCX2752183.1 cysteine peptidase family C39 domain-containing protein [Campylobacter sp. MIT 21-1682]MCX2808376.1 cysteine peptidase family C39 domain-containing protein [Campylobacter sp. MIT 21-1685]
MQRVLKILIILCFPLTLQADFVVKSYQELKNQRVVRQNYEESCGAASLATMINLIDKQSFNEFDILKTMSEKELYTDMVSFADLEEAVKKLGFQGNSYLINKEILNKLPNIPLLVKIEDDPRFPHFVVIINHKGNYIQIFDPSYGEYISSKRVFYNIWDKNNKGGYALAIVPKKDLENFKLDLPKKENFERRVFGRY